MRTIAERQAQPQDELQLFFTSMCETVKKCPPLLQAQAKLSVVNTIGKFEIEFFKSQQIQEEQQAQVIIISPDEVDNIMVPQAPNFLETNSALPPQEPMTSKETGTTNDSHNVT